MLNQVGGTQVLFSSTGSFPENFSASVDFGSGPDRVAFVCVAYEKWTDVNPQSISVGAQDFEHIDTVAAPGSSHAEWLSVWALVDPPEGSATVDMVNAPSGVDVRVSAFVLSGLTGPLVLENMVHIKAESASDDGTLSVDVDPDHAVVWFVVKDRSGASDFEPVAGSEQVDEGTVGYSGSGMTVAAGYADPGPGVATVGTVQVSADTDVNQQELVVIALEIRLAGTSSGGGDPGEPGECVCDVEMQTSATHIQYRVNGGAWADIVPLTAITGDDGAPGADGQDGAPGAQVQMQTAGGVVQWKYDNEPETAWRDLFTVPTGGGGTGTDGRTPELRVDGDLLQWKYTDETAWATLYDLSTLHGDTGPQGEPGADGAPGPAPEMRTSGDEVQWKHENETTWKKLYDIPAGGGGTVINVIGKHVSNKQMGIDNPGNDAELGRQRLQQFFDNIATDRVTGFLDEEYWPINYRVYMHDGMRLVGRGMHDTTIDCPTDQWLDDSRHHGLYLDVGSELHQRGIYLADFGIIGSDKDRTDDGPLIRLEGLSDGLVERVRVEDASSYGIFVTGYGLGNYVNEIDDPHWNNTFRVIVRDCLAYRGQIGFGTEGGAEGVLFLNNTAIGNKDTTSWGLHGFRSASGYNVHYLGNRSRFYRNGILLERWKNILVEGNQLQDVRNGLVIGSFYSSDPATSHDLRIIGNYFHCVEENGTGPLAINDSYLSNRDCEGVVVMGNHFSQGNALFRQARRLNIQGNTTRNGVPKIVTRDDASGLVSNNLMELDNSASGIIDGGNNIAL